MDAAKNYRILGEREIADLIREDGFNAPPSGGPVRGRVLSHSLARRPAFDDLPGASDAPYWGTWGTA
jgi:hypothetical protein